MCDKERDGCRGQDVCMAALPSNRLTLNAKDAAGGIAWKRVDPATALRITPASADGVRLAGRIVARKAHVGGQPLVGSEFDQGGYELFLPQSGTWYVGYEAANGSADIDVLCVPVPDVNVHWDDDEITYFTFTKVAITNAAAQVLVTAKRNRRLLSIFHADATTNEAVYIGNSDVATAQKNGFLVNGTSATSQGYNHLDFGKFGPMPRYRGAFWAQSAAASTDIVVIEGF